MSSDEVSQIKVGRHRMGIIGLKTIVTEVAETQLPLDFEHVSDIAEIGSYGVMGTPALVVNKKVVAVGTAPPKAKIKIWLQQAFSKT